MKTIAITGASGVVGTRLQQTFPDSHFLIYKEDIRDSEAVKKFCKDASICDAFIHLAALVPKQVVDSDPCEAFDINVKGTLNVLEGLKQLRQYAPWMFYASTSHAYASSSLPIKESDKIEPFTLYGLTKLQGEQWCNTYVREYGLKICIGRIFSFSDPLQSQHYFIPAMINKIITADKNATLEISGITGQRDFLTVEQICRTIDSLNKSQYTGTVNIGTGCGNSLLELVKKIAELSGRSDLTIVTKGDPPNYLVADTSKLNAMGITIENNLNRLLEQMIYEFKR